MGNANDSDEKISLSMPIDPTALALCILISFVAASIHGVIGIGFNFIAAPLLLLLYPQLVPAPIVIISVLIVCLVAWDSRKHVQYQGLAWLVGACALGAAGGSAAMSLLSETTYAAVFGALLLLAVVVSLLGWRPRLRPHSAIIAGSLSGFMGTITSVGGPPVALLYQRLPPAQLRGTISAYFLATCPIILVALYAAGRLGWAEIKLSAVLFPGMVLGFACSKILSRYLNQQATRAMVLVVSAVGGIALLARSL